MQYLCSTHVQHLYARLMLTCMQHLCATREELIATFLLDIYVQHSQATAMCRSHVWTVAYLTNHANGSRDKTEQGV